ncbi:hypothetical protein ADUPG1_010112 [Aduncisulcus paluster]|uniref:Uncharacterized protein n=1 Tax=Aduncisulcus paluster TaxID=2918883 RepID=A0ABQ5KZ17_9EUKA|nr:hypothetical protein ADUPG1_010112 [Aduncisulcus paluster]
MFILLYLILYIFLLFLINYRNFWGLKSRDMNSSSAVQIVKPKIVYILYKENGGIVQFLELLAFSIFQNFR